MHTDPIRGQLNVFITQKFPLARKRKIGINDHLLRDGIIDSLGVLDIVTYLEQHFRLAIADEDLIPENFETIGHIAAFVERKMGSTVLENHDDNSASSRS